MIKNSVHKYFFWLYGPLFRAIRIYKRDRRIKKEIRKLYSLNNDSINPRVYYLGITSHSNLGDMAQYYCICNWISDNYPDYELIKFEAAAVVDSRYGWIETFKDIYKQNDIIVFQSGYTTQDLGGNHDYMHRIIIDNIPDAKILMMPQTIYFKSNDNKKRTAMSYDKAQHMLFLARDNVSYDMALEMFPHVTVKAYPDIVTTLIGTYSFGHKRSGVCICTRNDGEKLYSKKQIDELALRLELQGLRVIQKDTQGTGSINNIRKNVQKYVENEIESYSNYQITITDRYHGTIFSLAAGTPVIILKTTDHKVITGADWFRGIYDDYVYLAKDLNDVMDIYRQIINMNISYEVKPYFKKHYYDHLRELFDQV